MDKKLILPEMDDRTPGQYLSKLPCDCQDEKRNEQMEADKEQHKKEIQDFAEEAAKIIDDINTDEDYDKTVKYEKSQPIEEKLILEESDPKEIEEQIPADLLKAMRNTHKVGDNNSNSYRKIPRFPSHKITQEIDIQNSEYHEISKEEALKIYKTSPELLYVIFDGQLIKFRSDGKQDYSSKPTYTSDSRNKYKKGGDLLTSSRKLRPTFIIENQDKIYIVDNEVPYNQQLKNTRRGKYDENPGARNFNQDQRIRDLYRQGQYKPDYASKMDVFKWHRDEELGGDVYYNTLFNQYSPERSYWRNKGISKKSTIDSSQYDKNVYSNLQDQIKADEEARLDLERAEDSFLNGEISEDELNEYKQKYNNIHQKRIEADRLYQKYYGAYRDASRQPQNYIFNNWLKAKHADIRRIKQELSTIKSSILAEKDSKEHSKSGILGDLNDRKRTAEDNKERILREIKKLQEQADDADMEIRSINLRIDNVDDLVEDEIEKIDRVIESLETRQDELKLQASSLYPGVKLESYNRKLSEAVVTVDLSEFKPWSGAIEVWDKIIDNGLLDQFSAYLDEIGYNQISSTDLNDLLWFDGDQVLSDLGLEEYDDE